MYNSISQIVNIQKDFIKDLSENEILDMLYKISSSSWFEGIKLGTEVEGNTFEEIKLVRELFPKEPIKFKIGGAGAKNDIRMAFILKVNSIILPMAETEYAIENFLETYHEFRDIFGFDIDLSINLETITMVKNFEKIKTYLNYFKQVTIGRSDLSQSMKEDVNSMRVLEIVKYIIDVIRSYKKDILISIGGKITPKASKRINLLCDSDFLNTQFVYVTNNKNVEKNIKIALIFESLLYTLFYKKKLRTDFELDRFINDHFIRMSK
jgi:hypothetical protein